MKLTLLCLLLCCGSAGAQTTRTCILGTTDLTAHCCLDGEMGSATNPCPEDSGYSDFWKAKWLKHEAEKKAQLICDWQKDHWYCPTREAVATENTALLYGNTVKTLGPFKCEGCIPFPDCDAPSTKPDEICAVMPPPFDVPPIHKAGQLSYTCADASRFYLKDEGGRGHCLALLGEGRKDQ